jgi:ADP-ribose pyrophosphatase
MKPHGPWKIVDSQEVYRDPWIAVRKDDVIRPDGRPGTYAVVHLKPGVSVLAMDDDQNVYLTQEFHYGVGRVTLEAVSGGIDEGEDALATARRELKEEIGIEAASWTDLGLVDPFTGSVVSPTRLYLARDLIFGSHDQEGTETIHCVKLPLSQAVHKVLAGEITHGPSCVVILKAWLKDSSWRG